MNNDGISFRVIHYVELSKAKTFLNCIKYIIRIF